MTDTPDTSPDKQEKPVLTNAQMADELAYSLGIAFENVMFNVEKCLYPLPSSIPYFGNFRNRPSLRREDIMIDEKQTHFPPPEEVVPPFAQMANKIHRVYRSDLFKRMPRLDNEALKETDEGTKSYDLVKELETLIKSYQGEVEQTRIRPDGTCDANEIPDLGKMPAERRKYFNDLADELFKALLTSSLATAQQIPVMVNGNFQMVDNIIDCGLSLGIRLFALNIASQSLTDENKLPGSLVRHLIDGIPITGQGQRILSIIKDTIGEHPQLENQCDAAFASCYPTIMATLADEKNVHSLQLAYLVSDKPDEKDNISFRKGCMQLLSAINKRPLPDSLQSPRECALVLESLMEYNKQSEATLRMLRDECDAAANSRRKSLSPGVAQSAEDSLHKIVSSSRNPMAQVKAIFIQDFLKRQRFIGLASRGGEISRGK